MTAPRYFVQLDEHHPSDPQAKPPIWFNKHHAWTNSTKFATPLARKQADKIAADQRAKPYPHRTITVVEAA